MSLARLTDIARDLGMSAAELRRFVDAAYASGSRELAYTKVDGAVLFPADAVARAVRASKLGDIQIDESAAMLMRERRERDEQIAARRVRRRAESQGRKKHKAAAKKSRR